jgi:hypothetical protein
LTAAVVPTTVRAVNQTLLVVTTLFLGLGLAYIVVVLLRGGGVSGAFNFLAALSVLGVGAGLLIGYQASYRLVTTMVQSLGNAGATIVFVVGYLFPDSPAPNISLALSIVVAVVSIIPRVAEVGTAVVMLVGSLVLFEATRQGYVFVWCIAATPLWMTAAAMLMGNGFANLSLRPTSPPGG